MNEEEQLLPAPKRRRLDTDPQTHQQQQDVIADSDEEEEEKELPLEADVVGETSLNDDEAPGDVSLTLLEADTSLPQPEEDEFDALYDDLDWDDGLLATDGETATRQIFSPKQTSIQPPAQHHPVSSPLKAGAAIDDDADGAREEINASPAGQSQQNASQPVDEDEAVYRAQEAAVAAKYGHLDYLSKFNALQTFTSPAPGGNSTFPSVGFTSVRGKVLVPSEESLAKASRLVQFSPDKEHGDGTTTHNSIASEDTPLPQRSRSALPCPAPGRSTAREASAPPTISRLPKPSEDIPLRPLRYGPKNGHSLLPSRMPNIAPRHAEDPGQGDETMAPPADTFAGFTSGSGKSVAMSSKEEVERLLANQDRTQEDLVNTHEPSSSPPQGYAGLSFAGDAAFKMPSKAMIDKERGKMNGNDIETSEDAAKIIEPNFESPARQVSAFSGLQSASGKPVALPPREAIDKAISGLDGASKTTAPSMAGGFTTGGGKAVAQPTEEQIRAAAARLDRHDDVGGRADFPNRQDEHVPAAKSGLTSGGGRPIAPPTDEALAASNLRLSKDANAAHVQSEKLASTPARSALSSKGVNTLPRSQARAITPGPRASTPATALNKPFKLAVAGRASSAAPSTPARVPSNTQIGSALQPRRLNLEMTPRNTPKSALNRSTFKTPFKNGQRPDPKVLEKLKEETNRTMVTPGKNVDVVASQIAGTPPRAPPVVAVKADHKVAKNSVFDLYTKVPRKSMAEYGFNPYVHIDDLIDCKLPTEVIFMTYAKAEAFAFRGEFGYDAAYEDLAYFSDCLGITLDWVKNHWSLVVWKTAAMVRAKPDELAKWWNFQRMIDQLKYRYEKEVVCGQRSCIRRIQERDSSPWLPMILVVTEIVYEEREIPPEPGSDEERQGIVRTENVAVALVLSDGWYKIRTSTLDDSLYRAICFRGICPGLKMRIQGAKLDGGSEGAEPLEAFATSTLVISGNSTSRAAWYEKLGFQKRPYICAFSSLLPDGGLVPFIDVIITRLYPLGYKGAYVQGESPDVWDENEEKLRQRQWENDRENALVDLQNEQRQAYAKLAKLQCEVSAHLRASQKKTGQVKDEDPALSDFSDVYDKLEEEPAKVSVILKRVSKDVLEDLDSFIRRRIEAFSAIGGQSLDKELEARCPPRVAKAFRIVRVKDARVPDGKARRDCQLNVNEVLQLGEDFLVEGKRYLISNVNPGRQSAWSAPNSIDGEIFLSTRFDSRWQVLPN